jgi:hypothetical protein
MPVMVIADAMRNPSNHRDHSANDCDLEGSYGRNGPDTRPPVGRALVDGLIYFGGGSAPDRAIGSPLTRTAACWIKGKPRGSHATGLPRTRSTRDAGDMASCCSSDCATSGRRPRSYILIQTMPQVFGSKKWAPPRSRAVFPTHGTRPRCEPAKVGTKKTATALTARTGRLPHHAP